jgi:hypothetical protein
LNEEFGDMDGLKHVESINSSRKGSRQLGFNSRRQQDIKYNADDSTNLGQSYVETVLAIGNPNNEKTQSASRNGLVDLP